MYNVGDIVLIPRGQKTNFFEVIKVEENLLWVCNGWIQIRKKPNEVELICKAEDRKDNKIPFNKYVNH